MRIRPGHVTDPGAAAWLEQLDAALDGRAHDPTAESWRTLREDVRALADPLDPELQRRLEQRIAERVKPAGRMRRRLPAWLRPGTPIHSVAALAVTAVLVVALIVVAPWRSSQQHSLAPSASAPASTHAAARVGHRGLEFGPGEAAPAVKAPGAHRGVEHRSALGPSVPAGPPRVPPATSTPTTRAGGAVRTELPPAVRTEPPSHEALAPAPSTPERKQQLAASMTLGPEREAVQSTSERVARIVVQDGGFVVHSNLQLQRTGTDEADLALELPSAKLSSALAALARLAPVDAQNQSLQDITNSYEAASHRLADARAERQALLRALSRANTEATIADLHRRLSQVDGAIARASTTLQGVTRRASAAEVEVTVVGQSRSAPPHTGSGGLTIDRGLRDAGHVLDGDPRGVARRRSDPDSACARPHRRRGRLAGVAALPARAGPERSLKRSPSLRRAV